MEGWAYRGWWHIDMYRDYGIFSVSYSTANRCGYLVWDALPRRSFHSNRRSSRDRGWTSYTASVAIFSNCSTPRSNLCDFDSTKAFYSGLIKGRCDDDFGEILGMDEEYLDRFFRFTFRSRPMDNFQRSPAWQCYRGALPVQDKLYRHRSRSRNTGPSRSRCSQKVTKSFCTHSINVQTFQTGGFMSSSNCHAWDEFSSLPWTSITL